MDGILVPLLSLIVGGALGLTCAVRPRLRAYSLAALVTTPATSVTFLLGAFLLADMNPAREYGTAYIPTGGEHDPTRLENLLWSSAVIATLILTAAAAYFGQRRMGQSLKRTIREDSVLGRYLLRDW